MATTDAWLLRVTDTSMVAVGHRELVHLEQEPELFEFPEAPHYCRHLIKWGNNLLPALDLAVWAGERSSQGRYPLAAIVGYQVELDARPKHGVILLEVAPQIIEVDGSQGCRLPVELLFWQRISKSCFRTDDGIAVPVLNFAALFESPPKRMPRPRQQVEVA